MIHDFLGKWITNDYFHNLAPRNVFHKQLDKISLDCTINRDKHILFRKKFIVNEKVSNAKIFLSADDVYKLYINGKFITAGPTSAYSFNYNYNEIDLTDFIKKGENVIAIHTLYQGLINRVLVSGDNKHGLIFDLFINDRIAVKSDEMVKTTYHTGYKEIGTVGYDTSFLEEYDSNAKEIGFFNLEYNDDYWDNSKYHLYANYNLVPQRTDLLVFENITPIKKVRRENSIFYDFGSNRVGYLYVKVKGISGEIIKIRAGQELNEDGTLRYNLRANCTYEETWILSDGICELDQFDYKSFRYAELTIPNGVEILDVYFISRHYPFKLSAKIKDEYLNDKDIKAIWDLCVNTQKFGVQEAVYDCMEREKGFYVGDGCYTALTHMILTNNDVMVKKLIDDAFSSAFITDGLVTCLNCSFMQEIAEYPLILVKLVLWHYNLTNDIDYLTKNYYKIVNLLDAYKKDYEKDYLLRDLDKWCVVEWPANFRDGYDVDIREGLVCKEPHVSINAYYIESISVANKIAKIINEKEYRDIAPLKNAFITAFYDRNKKVFKDGLNTSHVSIIGNVFPYSYDLCPDEESKENIFNMISNRKISALSFFTTFVFLEGIVRNNKKHLIKDFLLDKNAWLNMIKEGATTTFEGWSKDSKWNTSLFHLTFSYALIFISDVDLDKLFIN